MEDERYLDAGAVLIIFVCFFVGLIFSNIAIANNHEKYEGRIIQEYKDTYEKVVEMSEHNAALLFKYAPEEYYYNEEFFMAAFPYDIRNTEKYELKGYVGNYSGK